MDLLVFLDTNVFIWGYNRTGSNSDKILELMSKRKISVVVSEKVLDELRKYFVTYYTKDVYSTIFQFVSLTAKIIPRDEVLDEMNNWKNKIKSKDLEQLAVVKKYGIKYLISYDKDFEPFGEYVTPKKFIKLLGMTPAKTEY